MADAGEKKKLQPQSPPSFHPILQPVWRRLNWEFNRSFHHQELSLSIGERAVARWELNQPGCPSASDKTDTL